MILLAIIFPWLSFAVRGKYLSAIVSLILQATLIGWIPASIWAVKSIQSARLLERNEHLIRIVMNSSNYNMYTN